MVRDAVEAGVGVLGVLRAGNWSPRPLGGTVGRSGTPEVGWYVESRCRILPRGLWFQWHSDRWTVPLAPRSPATPMRRRRSSPAARWRCSSTPSWTVHRWSVAGQRHRRDVPRPRLDVGELRRRTDAEQDAAVERLGSLRPVSATCREGAAVAHAPSALITTDPTRAALAAALAGYRGRPGLVVVDWPGGVPVAAEVAEARRTAGPAVVRKPAFLDTRNWLAGDADHTVVDEAPDAFPGVLGGGAGRGDRTGTPRTRSPFGALPRGLAGDRTRRRSRWMTDWPPVPPSRAVFPDARFAGRLW